MTQNATLNVDNFTAQQTVVVDLDHFSLYASYLVVVMFTKCRHIRWCTIYSKQCRRFVCGASLIPIMDNFWNI